MEETIQSEAMNTKKKYTPPSGIDIVGTTDALLAQLETDPWMKPDDAIDMAKAAIVSLNETLEKAIIKGQLEFKTKDFFIEIFIRQDPKLPANHYVPTVNIGPFCPTPTHDAAVWKIH